PPGGSGHAAGTPAASFSPLTNLDLPVFTDHGSNKITIGLSRKLSERCGGKSYNCFSFNEIRFRFRYSIPY
ncbi:MAG: hypothetical protein ACE5D7_00400, partial [Fidelibacterota bacterium]